MKEYIMAIFLIVIIIIFIYKLEKIKFLQKKIANILTIIIPIVAMTVSVISQPYSLSIVLGFLFLLSFVLGFVLVKNKFQTKKYVTDYKTSKIAVKLPIDAKYSFDSHLIENIPSYVDSISYMCEAIRIATNEFILKFEEESIDEKRELLLQAFFTSICYTIATMFDNSTRVHVRKFNGHTYSKFVATYSRRLYSTSMKDMSFGNLMIEESFKKRCSLIKTLNPKLHEDGSSYKFKNYLTFALPQITKDNKPIFSMGISVTDKRNELLFFLNYCRIETLIGQYIADVAKNRNFTDFIDRFYFK